MEIEYTLTLPRDALTVAIVRRLAKGAMMELGVTARDISDVALALTEACANVIQHASEEHDEYRVLVAINEEECEIRVIDTGRGFDAEHLTKASLHEDMAAERGRGVRLMRALVDSALFDSAPEQGTIVHLRKHLELEDDSLFRRIAERAARN